MKTRTRIGSTGAVIGVVSVALVVFAVVAGAASAAGPVTWVPEQSTYGARATGFMALPSPAPAGSGMTQHGDGVAYAAGHWDARDQVYRFGLQVGPPSGSGLPSAVDADVSGTMLHAGTPVTLVFHKPAGRVIDSIAVSGDLSKPLLVQPADAEALVAGDTFTVTATVGDPVAGESGDAGAALGVIVDLSPDPTRFQHVSLLATDLGWLVVGPPRFRADGLAGLRAWGRDGVTARVDAFLSPMFLDMTGIADPSAVKGYVDGMPVTAMPDLTFEGLGAGDGSSWPAGTWRFRVASSMWSAHDVAVGRLRKPAATTPVSPHGAVHGARPVFRWKPLTSASSYRVRVYRGSRLVLDRDGITSPSWRADVRLPGGVSLSWTVRGSNETGHGPWSPRLGFTVH